jgi:predicted RNA-binding protein
MIIGQERICHHIDSCGIDNFPRTLLLLGGYGSGKHLLTEYIANKFNLEIEDISDNLTLETIDNITHRVYPKIYVIDSKKLTIKNENVILKFLEEPLKNSFVVVLCEHKSSIIPTVWNRCQVWELEAYEQDFLNTFTQDKNEYLLRVANTPGKIVEYQHFPLKDMFDLAYKIFNSIKKANFANVLTISRFIAFKNEKDKFDFNLFLDILLIVCKEMYWNQQITDKIYWLTNDLNNNKYIFNIDKKSLFEHYLIELKLLNTEGLK